MANPQELSPHQERVVQRVRETTTRVRDAEHDLERARLARRAAIKAASDAGVTIYRIAQEAETSHASAWRIVHEFDEKWRATFERDDTDRDNDASASEP